MTTQYARNASLEDLVTILQDQHGKKLDVVAGAGAIRSEDGILHLKGTDADISPEGVTATEGRYRPTTICDEGLSSKLGIPLPYFRRLRDQHVDLLDANVNGWLDREDRSFLVRCFRGNGEGVARAFLSDRFKIVDNLDVLTAALDGVRAAGVDVNITGCDLSERKMYVRVDAPEVKAYAPKLLERYRSPFTGASGQDNPTTSAGLVISNSETGGGAFTIAPRITVLICKNGMTMEKDALRAVHLGGRMDEGVINWSEDTLQKTLELVTARTRDAVATFLDVDYVSKVIERLEQDSDTPVARPTDVIETLGKKLVYTEEAQAGILDHFIKGGDTTAGGILQAVTSYAQTVDDPDVAAAMEGSAVKAFELVVAEARQS